MSQQPSVNRPFVDHGRQVVFIPIPKNGTDYFLSWHLWMRTGQASFLKQRQPAIHAIADIYGGSDSPPAEYLTWAIIRHPLRRLVSAFCDKLNDPSKRSYQPRLTFARWIEWLWEQRQAAEAYDPHWRPQHWFLGRAGRWPVLCRLEHLDEDIAPICRYLGQPIPRQPDIKARYRRYTDWREFYDKRLSRLACEAYDRDMQLYFATRKLQDPLLQ